MDSAIKKAILNYANFSGVAGRKDFWLFIFVCAIYPIFYPNRERQHRPIKTLSLTN